jgi:hypothetical protein
MGNYSSDWYDRYRAYLEEPLVRERHDEMFRLFAGFFEFQLRALPYERKEAQVYDRRDMRVIDLGCATQEFRRNCRWVDEYFGIDKLYIQEEYYTRYYGEAADKIATLGDYLKLNLTKACPFKPNAFVSLFSTEIIMSAPDKYKFYKRVFTENPSIEVGLVAGFYYKGFEDCSTYEEDHGIIYQTIENQIDYTCNTFDELRMYTDIPPGMFKDEFIECWKFFRRRNND